MHRNFVSTTRFVVVWKKLHTVKRISDYKNKTFLNRNENKHPSTLSDKTTVRKRGNSFALNISYPAFSVIRPAFSCVGVFPLWLVTHGANNSGINCEWPGCTPTNPPLVCQSVLRYLTARQQRRETSDSSRVLI